MVLFIPIDFFPTVHTCIFKYMQSSVGSYSETTSVSLGMYSVLVNARAGELYAV